ncbi:Methionine import ATP-binding protein MetN [compost metagenome]
MRKTLTTDEGSRLYKLEFFGERASEPVLYELIRSSEVKFNILFANMTEIQDTTLGTMIIQLQGNSVEMDKALAFLKSKAIVVEEVEKHVFNNSDQ